MQVYQWIDDVIHQFEVANRAQMGLLTGPTGDWEDGTITVYPAALFTFQVIIQISSLPAQPPSTPPLSSAQANEDGFSMGVIFRGKV